MYKRAISDYGRGGEITGSLRDWMIFLMILKIGGRGSRGGVSRVKAKLGKVKSVRRRATTSDRKRMSTVLPSGGSCRLVIR